MSVIITYIHMERQGMVFGFADEEVEWEASGVLGGSEVCDCRAGNDRSVLEREGKCSHYVQMDRGQPSGMALDQRNRSGRQ